MIKDIPFNYSGHDGAYLYCAQYCDNDVVIAGGSGTNSIQAVNKVTGEVSLINLIRNVNELSPFHIFCWCDLNSKKKMVFFLQKRNIHNPLCPLDSIGGIFVISLL